MANIKHFSDWNGTTVELAYIRQMKNAAFATQFPGIKGRRCDSFTMWVGATREAPRDLLPVTRVIEYKRNPSKHECNAKCLNGSARGACECRCGGKNHGAGSFVCAPSE
jgi:hypothetical protein